MPELSSEDAKLFTLARAARARVDATEGAAVRDDTGRTYAAGRVDLPSLRLSALQVAVAMAATAGAAGLEAAVRVGDVHVPDEQGRAAVRDLGTHAPVYMADTDGALHATLDG